MLRYQNIFHAFGATPALGGIDLTCAAKRTTVLIGPSGCGKSTLLRLAVGLIVPMRGTVFIDGTAMTPATAEKLRRRIGYVIQDGGLFPHFTARGNVCVMARHLGWTAARIDERLRMLNQLTRFPEDALERYPAELSGGQRQRVALMRALMLDPDLLLLDEPLGALDPVIRFELQDQLKGIFRRLGKTVVLVTHDMAEAAYLGDDIVLMRAGRVEQRGPVAELLRRPASAFVRRFITARRSLNVGEIG